MFTVLFNSFSVSADCCGITRIEIWQDEDYNEFKLHIFSAVLPLPLLTVPPVCEYVCARGAYGFVCYVACFSRPLCNTPLPHLLAPPVPSLFTPYNQLQSQLSIDC